MRYPLIVGNWKLNGTKYIINEMITILNNNLKKIIKNCNVVITPPNVYLDFSQKKLYKSKIILGAQDVDIHLFGSFTGETSAKMLKDLGVKYTIIGHSERRLYHNEYDEIIIKKLSILKKESIIPIICIGENLSDKENGKTQQICINIIDKIIKKLGVESLYNTVIAYEPIWAIGNNQSAKPNYVQQVNKFIRDHISKYDLEISKNIIIQYGGSVNHKNAFLYLEKPDIDGLIIGNTSLNPNYFTEIIKFAIKEKFLKKMNI
ncbi:MAG: triose-phosphate isomerase [Candidatus Makana argininalis]